MYSREKLFLREREHDGFTSSARFIICGSSVRAGIWSINWASTALGVARCQMKKDAALPLALVISPSGDKEQDIVFACHGDVHTPRRQPRSSAQTCCFCGVRPTAHSALNGVRVLWFKCSLSIRRSPIGCFAIRHRSPSSANVSFRGPRRPFRVLPPQSLLLSLL